MDEVRETLIKMRDWIDMKLKEAKKPYAEPFVLTSLGYCAYQAAPEAQAEAALALLREVRIEEWQMLTYDVMGPQSVVFLINRTLKTRC